jgi:hypothetical protein
MIKLLFLVPFLILLGCAKPNDRSQDPHQDSTKQNSKKLYSDGGVDISGGGNLVDGVLQDVREYSEAQIIDHESVLNFIKPHLSLHSDNLPYLATALEVIVRSKVWLLQPNPKFSKNCINPSLSDVKTEVVACQNKVETWISLEYWNSSSGDEQAIRRSEILIHEIIGTIIFYKERPYSYSRMLTAKFLSGNSYEASKFYEYLGFGVLPTAAAIDLAIVRFKELNSNRANNPDFAVDVYIEIEKLGIYFKDQKSVNYAFKKFTEIFACIDAVRCEDQLKSELKYFWSTNFLN